MEKKKHLVVGATGGIGRAVVKALKEKGENVAVLVRNVEKAQKYFEEFSDVEILKGDAKNKNDILSGLNGSSHLYYCTNIPYQDWEKNALDLLRVSLSAASEAKVKFVLPGNVYVYGHAESNPVNEQHPWNAHTKKGRIRIVMEKEIQKTSEKEGLFYTIVRFPDFYGPYVINGFSEKIFINSLKGKRLQWIGDKQAETEYIFIEDAGKAMATAALSDKSNNQEFNVPAYRPITTMDFLNLVSKKGGNSSMLSVINSDLIFTLMGLFNPVVGEVKEMLYLKREKLVLDGTKFKDTFGEIPSTPYEEGVEKTMEWTKKFFSDEV